MLSLIVAVASNGAIGNNNSMPWHLPGDLKYFKNKTMGKTLIMGRKTFESLPGVLPNRRHIVITSDLKYADLHPDIETAASLKTAIAKAKVAWTSGSALAEQSAPPEGEAFIIGGGRVYREALSLCNRLYITEVYADFDADTFFPEVDFSHYNLVCQSEMFHENGVDYRFLCYAK